MSKAESKGACLVVGAGDGVGGAIAKAFSLGGFEVVVSDWPKAVRVRGAKLGETLHRPNTD